MPPSSPPVLVHRPSSIVRRPTAKQELTEWDCIAGDGDCGATFKRGAEAIIAALDANRLPKDDLRSLLRAVSDTWV